MYQEMSLASMGGQKTLHQTALLIWPWGFIWSFKINHNSKFRKEDVENFALNNEGNVYNSLFNKVNLNIVYLVIYQQYKTNIFLFYCKAPTQLPTPSPLQPNFISTPSQFNSSKSWVGVIPYNWFVPPPTTTTTTILLFWTTKPRKLTPSTQVES